MQVSLVTMSRPSPGTAAPPCLLLDIKDSLKEDVRLFLCGLLVFWCGRLLFGRKGKELLKGKDC
jgi:hypothetical protein